MGRLLIPLLLVWAQAAGAAIETYEFESDDLRQRYQQLSDELRCPKCQNQNIADSNAPIAQDLRQQLHSQLHAGKDDQAILDYMVQRYGEFVLYRPRWSLATAVLWLAPVILLLLAALLVLTIVRRGRSPVEPPPQLDTEEQQRLRSLLDSERNRG